jgi:hypothetical protein
MSALRKAFAVGGFAVGTSGSGSNGRRPRSSLRCSAQGLELPPAGCLEPGEALRMRRTLKPGEAVRLDGARSVRRTRARSRARGTWQASAALVASVSAHAWPVGSSALCARVRALGALRAVLAGDRDAARRGRRHASSSSTGSSCAGPPPRTPPGGAFEVSRDSGQVLGYGDAHGCDPEVRSSPARTSSTGRGLLRVASPHVRAAPAEGPFDMKRSAKFDLPSRGIAVITRRAAAPRVVVTLLVWSSSRVIGPAQPTAPPRGPAGIAPRGRYTTSPPTSGHASSRLRAVGARWDPRGREWNVVQAQGPRSWNWAPFEPRDPGRARARIRVRDDRLHAAWARPPGAVTCIPRRACAATRVSPRRFARAYRRHGVHHWEIWNEPNVGRSEPRRARRQVLAPPSRRLRRAQASRPQSVVVSGGSRPSLNDAGTSRPLALRGMYRRGVRRYIDAVGHHASTFPFRPSVRATGSAWRQMAWTSPSLRGVMQRHGDGHKRI